MAELAPGGWRPDCEYEDDFCYAQFLHHLLAVEPWRGPPANAILERFEAALEGTGSARLAVCRALRDRDAAGFETAFEALLLEHVLGIEERIELGEMDDPVVVAERLVFVEGLGLLGLAEQQGLSVEQEFLYCPSIARAWPRAA